VENVTKEMMRKGVHSRIAKECTGFVISEEALKAKRFLGRLLK